jgi:daunorubicin resistance ABC transporter ATP-binding subunit
MGAIQTFGLSKSYGGLRAADRLDLDVDNEIFGLVGPNGSGKTTTVMMLTTLLRPTAGKALVCGHDIVKDAARVREAISYVPQDMALDISLTGRENVWLFARLYGVDDRKRRIDDILRVMGMGDREADRVRTYSGGMRRRLELAQAMVHEPKVLFLDEPTLGLDVAARKKIWAHIVSLRDRGMTVFVTTHYMDEADRYCDRIAIIDRGKIVAMDTPEALKSSLKRDVIIVSVDDVVTDGRVEGIEFAGEHNGELRYFAPEGSAAVELITRALEAQGLTIRSLTVRKPSLDDVFISKVSGKTDTDHFDDQRFRLMLRRRR